jgi:hypothetical protein
MALSAASILAVHLSIIAFNLLGLVVIPVGAWRGWNFVHAPLWRLLHLASLGVVAAQAVIRRACFLTIWQAALEGKSGSREPFIMHWINTLVYWPLPMWVFETAYILVFIYVLALIRIVPLHWRR